MKMDTERGPVVIVVSDDSENNKVSIDDYKIESIVDVNKVKIEDVGDTFTGKVVSKPHSVLCKYNSYPLEDRNHVNNHLRVPCQVSNSETDSSLYSSDGQLSSNHQDLSSSSDLHLDRISCCSSQDDVISSSQIEIRKNNRYHSFSEGKVLQLNGNSLSPGHFQHKPLTRAASAPLKSNEQSTIAVENGLKKDVDNNNNNNDDNDNNRNTTSRYSLSIAPKVIKNAVKRVRSAEPPRVSSNSAFSLRRTVSNSLRGWSKESSSSFISFPSKNKKKPRQRYKIVEAKTGQRDGLSFEVVGKQGTFLRVKGSILITDKDTSDTHFNKDCTFVPLPDMWFPSFFAFESVSKPSHFLRLTTHEELVLEKYDCTKDFKEEASFQLNRKPCATCLQVGIQTWAKKTSGEFCLGKVLSIQDETVDVRFNDGRILKYPMNDTGDLVPDIIPSPEDISIGTKVIAQWLSRNKLYPGVVSGIRGGDSYEVLFDDGDVCREKAFQIRLIRAYFFHPGDNADSEILNNLNNNACNHSHCTDNGISVHQHYKTDYDENTHSRLSYSDSNPDSPGLSEVLSAGLSSSIINSDINENGYIGSRKYTDPPWEMETYSQDSGYHGYDKQNKDKLTVDKNGISEHDNHYHGIDCSTKFKYINKTSNGICKKFVRSKSLDDAENELAYRFHVRKAKSLSFKDISSFHNCHTILVNS